MTAGAGQIFLQEATERVTALEHDPGGMHRKWPPDALAAARAAVLATPRNPFREGAA